MSPLEIAGSLLGLANVALLWRRSIWNFPFGMAMVSLYAVIFWQARLYSEAGLQAFFFAVNIYGWMLWQRGGGGDRAVEVEWLTRDERLVWAAGTVAISLTLGWLMHSLTNAALPFIDSAIAGASVAAQFLLSYRKIENWILWILIDVASIGLFVNRELYLTSGLYVLLLGLSILGLRDWMRAVRPPVFG